MGKIKSAKELAMERTAGIDGPAKAGNFAKEQYTRAAVSLASSHMAGKNSLERVMDSLERYPAGVKTAAVEVFLQKAGEDMRIDNCERAAEAWMKLSPAGAGHDAAASLKELAERYRQSLDGEREKAEQKTMETLLEELNRAGIGGSAIGGVNLDRSSLWEQKRSEIAARFAARFEDLKKLLLR